MNKKLLTPLLILPMLLTSCENHSIEFHELGLKVLSPIGAPSVALAPYANDTEHVTIASSPMKVIPPAFLTGSQDFIIFDGYKGSKMFIESKAAKYKYVRTVTTGNTYLIDLGNDENKKVEEGDKIVTFGDAKMPALFNAIFKKMYNVSSYTNLESTGLAAQVLATGLLEGEKQDYVIVAEPFVTQNLAKNKNASIVCNLSDEFAKYSKEQGYNGGKGYTSFPQAGLFMNEKLENTTDEALISERDDFLKAFDSFTDDLQNYDGAAIKELIRASEANGEYEAKTTFGVSYETLEQVLVGNKLAFNTEDFDVNAFYNDVNLPGYKAFKDTTFSKFYR